MQISLKTLWQGQRRGVMLHTAQQLLTGLNQPICSQIFFSIESAQCGGLFSLALTLSRALSLGVSSFSLVLSLHSDYPDFLCRTFSTSPFSLDSHSPAHLWKQLKMSLSHKNPMLLRKRVGKRNK